MTKAAKVRLWLHNNARDLAAKLYSSTLCNDYIVMSWLANMEGRPDPNFRDEEPKVPDPAIPNRMVSTKRANRPFLA